MKNTTPCVARPTTLLRTLPRPSYFPRLPNKITIPIFLLLLHPLQWSGNERPSWAWIWCLVARVYAVHIACWTPSLWCKLNLLYNTEQARAQWCCILCLDGRSKEHTEQSSISRVWASRLPIVRCKGPHKLPSEKGIFVKLHLMHAETDVKSSVEIEISHFSSIQHNDWSSHKSWTIPLWRSNPNPPPTATRSLIITT